MVENSLVVNSDSARTKQHILCNQNSFPSCHAKGISRQAKCFVLLLKDIDLYTVKRRVRWQSALSVKV
jgi:phosphatidylethanolamine-binding protein (PEBP) family uncharacterized protein